MENNATLTTELKAEIENLMKLAEQYNGGCMITAHRYAVKNNMVFDNKNGFRQIEVTRYIHNYGSEVVTVNDVIDDCPMYYKEDIQKAGLDPVSEKHIAQYGKITKIVIDDKNGRRTYNI